MRFQAHNLSAEDLKKREVITIDIANDTVEARVSVHVVN